VQAALEKVSQGRTTITIAHRLSTIKKADEIIVLDKGSVVEQGSHQALMAASGAYSQLVRGQSLSATAEEGTHIKEALLDVQHDEEIKSSATSDAPVQDDVNTEQGTKETRRSLKNSFGTLLWREKSHFPHYAGVIASAMAISAGTPLQAWLFSQVINVFLLPAREMASESSFWALMWLALAGGVGIAYFSTGIISLYVQHAISAVYKRVYFTDMLRQRLAFFDMESNSHGALSARIASDAKHLEELLGINMAFFFVGIFTVVGCAIIALVFAWRLALVATLVTMPIMLIAGYRKFRYEVEFNDMNAAVFKESSQFATEAIGAIRTVSALNMEEAIIQRYKKLMDNHVRIADVKARWTALLFGFADSVSLGCQALVFWYGGTLLVNGEYSIEAFLVCFMATVYGSESASLALSISPHAANVVAAANRILDVEKSASQSTNNSIDKPVSQEAAQKPDDDGVRIELRDVSFQYPTRQVPVFESFDLTFEKGKYVALVGSSGCGKSTIIALLERFYDIKAGQGAILCNGININDIEMHTYRRQLALVPQEPTLFQGSIRDNVLLGIDDPTSITDQMIEQVCRDAFIHDFIVSLPEGYSTNVGQRGVAMSGGQKQRLAIARALIRDPKVLLLDEATSALDSESENVVQAAIEKARQGRTVIAVAHRLSTIRDADVIVVLDDGQVIEKGTHNELLQRHGVYWEMVSIIPLELDHNQTNQCPV
jgi:ATP-binding cassette subfamily B (MDR/TAP) protein 1